MNAPRNLFRWIADLFVGALKTLTRVTAFVGKELTEVIRRPGVLFSLILGPFLIMALFGAGYSGYQRPLDTVVVVPANAGIPRDIGFYQQLVRGDARILDVTDDLASARDRLARQQIDLVVVAPADLQAEFLAGRQSVVTVEYNQIDPVQDGYVRLIAQKEVQELNRVLIERVVSQGQAYAFQTQAAPQAARIPSEVVASPTRPDTHNLAPLNPTVVQFYAPAVLALVLQHMGVTLAALSIVRERLNGAMDLFRVAPVRSIEILTGKYLAFSLLNLGIAALVTYLMVHFLAIPMLGTVEGYAAVVVLLTFASLGLGLLISTVADSERQAVQLSMLLLLASVFLSGFVLPLEQFSAPVRYVGYGFPVTYGIRLLQDLMLRGGTNALWQFWALAGFGVVLMLATVLTLRRNLAAE